MALPSADLSSAESGHALTSVEYELSHQRSQEDFEHRIIASEGDHFHTRLLHGPDAARPAGSGRGLVLGAQLGEEEGDGLAREEGERCLSGLPVHREQTFNNSRVRAK